LKYAIADGNPAPCDNPDVQPNSANVMIGSKLAPSCKSAGALQLVQGDMTSDGFINTAECC
jgi:hypothetical protein